MAQLSTRVMEMVHARDPADAIREDIGEYVDTFDVTGKDVMLVAYQRDREDRTKGGILLPDSVRDEDGIQGISFLVVRIGPFVKDVQESGRFGDHVLKVGDWVLADCRNGFRFLLKKRNCCLLQAEYIMSFIPRPDMVL